MRLYEELATEAARAGTGFAKRGRRHFADGTAQEAQGVDAVVSFAPAHELGGDFHDFLVPDTNTLIVAVGDVGRRLRRSTRCLPASWCEAGRTAVATCLNDRRGGVLSSINTILHERQLGEHLLHVVLDLRPEAPDGDAR